MKVICYGDSNTYGFDPRGWLGERYGADDRWVDILARRTGWEILNGGMNGREIPPQAPAFPADTDLLMVMLGTNDLLQGRTPSETAQRMLRFLAGLTVGHDKILLIAPPPVAFGAWVQEQRLIDASAELAVQYRALAERLGSVLPTPGRGVWAWHTTACTLRKKATGPLRRESGKSS